MQKPMERRLAALDRPLIFVALFAVILYLLQLFRLIPAELRAAAFWVGFLVDFIFLCDLLTKSIVLGRSYLKSPWFIVDLISTTPIIGSAIEAFAMVGVHMRFLSAVRIARVARLGRAARLAGMARVARVVRALRAARGLQFLRPRPDASQPTPTFDRAIRYGVPAVLAAFVALAFYIEHLEVGSWRDGIQSRLAAAADQRAAAALPGYLSPEALARAPLTPHVVITHELGGRSIVSAFATEAALVRSDRIQGLLVIFVLLTILAVAYMGKSLARDQRRTAEAALLDQCFSPPIVDTFFRRPEILDRYYQPWMSVFFVDVRGFTAATQKHANDLEGLALRLRRVMDIAREEIVVTYQGVVDKFMGDAVMGWIGGQFSRHWGTISTLRQELLFDALESAANDVNTLARGLSDIQAALRSGRGDDPELRQNAEETRVSLEEARGQLRSLEAKQRALLDASPDLRARYEQAFGLYRREVARAAVHCMLRVSERAAAQDEPEAFRELKIGVASGPVCVGNFGSSQQVGFTILGPTVNRAARLEPASYQCGCRVLVDGATRDLVGDDDELVFRCWGEIEVKGIDTGLTVHEPLRATPETRTMVALFHQARERIEAGALEEAVTLFEQADAARPDRDPASQRWVATVKAALAQGQRTIATYHATK